MAETRTPAQDLATLDRVTDLALAADLITEEFAEILDRLRAPIALEQDRYRALCHALAVEWKWDERELAADLERAADRILTAIGAAGAQIVWPSPPLSGEIPAQADEVAGVQGWMTADLWAALGRDPGEFDSYLDTVGFGETWAALLGCVRHATRPETAETPDRGSADDTAPAIDTASATVKQCQRNPNCWLPDEHPDVCLFPYCSSNPEPTPRWKILAEVAALEWPDDNRWPTISSIVDAANTVAEGSVLNERDEEVYYRPNLVRAAAILLAGALRMDGDR